MTEPRKPKHAGGRPTAYKGDYVRQAEQLCALGATDFELAAFFGVTVQTVNRWKLAHPEFCSSIKTAKEAADERVERSLYNRATGYTFSSEKVFQFQGSIVRAPVDEHVPPDPTSAIFWLKNRRKDVWRDRHEIEHSGKVTIDDVTDDALLDIACGSGERAVAAAGRSEEPH